MAIEGNHVFAIQEHFQLFLPLLRIVVLQFLVGDVRLVLLDFSGFDQLFVD